jgi:type II secretory pathway component GspD/PulD (secretin)
LSRLPWIGSIFGQKGRDNKKTDLVIMLTPHIFNLNQIEKITREREERLESLRQEIEKQVDPKAGQKKK